MTDEQAGSLIAMAFNATGDILASREGGGLLLIRDKDKDGTFESVEPFCDEVKNVQGILSLGNRVYAVGDGPDGGALYQITDEDGDGQSDKVAPLVKFRGAIGEHGPHTVRLGPRWLAVRPLGQLRAGRDVDRSAEPVRRRRTKATWCSRDTKIRRGTRWACRRRAARSFAPTRTAASSRWWPAGSAIRTTSRSTATASCSPTTPTWNGTSARRGIGRRASSTCRRAANLAGGAAGRSGRRITSIACRRLADIGPGSPTGVVYYDHTAFPPRLQNTLFIGDWALGQIHAVRARARRRYV